MFANSAISSFSIAASIARPTGAVALKRPLDAENEKSDEDAPETVVGRPTKFRATDAPRLMAPPQLVRPNVSTEDTAAWNSDPNKKDKAKTWKEREKRKRDIGQSARGKVRGPSPRTPVFC